ncbi:hypothetical protein FACS189454_10350 [Planctomycetales bacterium]|nr:hypothetical protein FACS189454_10350 [Planctomycetales bacterium]
MLLGLDNNYTCGARRLIVFAVAKSSYETAAFQLKEFGCITVSHQTVSNLVPSLSDEVSGKLANNACVRQAFQEAKGDTEFTTDEAFIKIRNEDKSHCWMECKVADFAKRERGKSATADEWDSRDLPKPTVNMAIATLEKIDKFMERCKVFRFNLGVGGDVSVLGDGAKWIWNLSEYLFGNTAECLDIFHAAEHISCCGKMLFPDNDVQRKNWFEDERMLLLCKGFCGVNKELTQECKSGCYDEEQRSAMGSLQNSLFNYRNRLSYAERLFAGRAIGSGIFKTGTRCECHAGRLV